MATTTVPDVRTATMTDTPLRPDLVVGDDGHARCWWGSGDPLYVSYHDDEWGRPLRDEHALFGLLCLEFFQSGLSWLTILRKRDGFRRAFDDWDLERVANYGDRDTDRLLADASIVRHRGKIEAAIANAGATLALHRAGESLDELLWRFAPSDEDRRAPESGDELPSVTLEATAMAKELKVRGFRFVGPTTAHSLMQAAGLVNDHLAGCELRL